MRNVILFFLGSIFVTALLPISAMSQETKAPVTAQAAKISATPLKTALSFESAFNTIVERNLELKSQGLEVDTQRARRLQAIGTFTPSISLQGTSSRQGEVPTSGRRTAAAVLSANLFHSGTDIAGIKAGNRDVEASRANLLSVRQKAEDDSLNALIQVISRVRQREINEKIVGLKRESVKIASERYRKGLLPQQEVDKTQIDLDNSVANLVDVEVQLAEARANLTSRLGSDEPVAPLWPWKGSIEKGPKLEVVSFDLEKRPDYRASVLTLEAESLRRYNSLGALLPSIDFEASYGNFDLTQTDRRDWSAVLTLTIPIFENFRGWSNQTIQRLVREDAELRREGIARFAPAETESLKITFTNARESAIARERTAKLTERLYDDNVQRFRLGRASVNDLAIDQNRLLQSQLLEVEGWASAHLSFARLCHALGRFVTAQGECRESI